MSQITHLFSMGGIWMWAILAAGVLHLVPIAAQFLWCRRADFSAYLWGGLAAIVLIGLTGTAVGCMQGFDAIVRAATSEQFEMLVRVLSIALIPTVFAMLVVIPGLFTTGIASSLARNLAPRGVSQTA